MFRKDRSGDRPARPKPGQRGGEAQPKLDTGRPSGPTLARTSTPRKAEADTGSSQPARAPWPKPSPPGVTPNRLSALLGEPVTRPVSAPADPPPSEPRRDTGKRMHIGQDISISGEITTCDVLVVDGHVDAKVRDCGRLEIGPAGTLHGDVEVRNAEIGGHFDGELNVTDRLTVRGTGRVSGTVRYGRLEVTVGGQLRGDIAPAEEREEAAESPAQAAQVPEPTSAATERPSAASILRPAPRPEPIQPGPTRSGPTGPAPTAAASGARQEPPAPAMPAPANAPAGAPDAEPAALKAANNGADADEGDGAEDAAHEEAEEGADAAPAERGSVTRLLGQRAAE